MKRIIALVAITFNAAPTTGCLMEEEPPGTESESAELLSPVVDDVSGLPGIYVRVPPLPLAGTVKTLWLGSDLEPGGSVDGTYVRTLFPAETEVGGYHALPQNPAIGFAFIQLLSDDGEQRDVYVIDATAEDVFGRILTMVVRRLDEDGFGLPFLLQRMI